MEKKYAGKLLWIKLWTEELIEGTTFDELDDADVGIFIKLMALASRGRNKGFAEIRDESFASEQWFIESLKILPENWRRGIPKLIKVEKIELLKNNEGLIRIKIINYKKYQPDWQRIKDYPSQRGVGKLQKTLQETLQETLQPKIQQDKDKDKDKDKELDKDKENKRNINPCRLPKPNDEPINEIFKFCQLALPKIPTTLSKQRKIGIEKALKFHKSWETKLAIMECQNDDFMKGDNPNHKSYASIDYMFCRQREDKILKWLESAYETLGIQNKSLEEKEKKANELIASFVEKRTKERTKQNDSTNN